MLKYLLGDATDPIKKPAIIAHVCNDIGLMGSGFVVPLYTKNPKVKSEYVRWYRDTQEGLAKPPLRLGEVQVLEFQKDVLVANMIAQQETIRTNRHPLKYEALDTCLLSVYEKAVSSGLSVHMPRIGAERAGGTWSEIEKVILKVIAKFPVESYVYTLPDETWKWLETTYETL